MALAEERSESEHWQCSSSGTAVCHPISHSDHRNYIPAASDSEHSAEHKNDDDIEKSLVETYEKSASSSAHTHILSLEESVGTSSDVQEDSNNMNTGNPIPQDHNQLVVPKSDRLLSCISHKFRRIVKRNKSDKSVKTSKSNSKECPSMIKTIQSDNEKGCMYGIGFSKNGILAVTDHSNHRVHVYNAIDVLTKVFGSKGKGNHHFDHPVGVAFDNKNCLYVSDYGNHRVHKFDANFELVLHFGNEGGGDGQLNHPMGIAAYKDKVYVADSANSRIAMFYTNGNFCRCIIGGCLRDPQDVAIGEAIGQMFVVDYSTCCVHIFALDEAYTYIRKFSSLGIGKDRLNHPRSLAVDSNGFIFVADTYSHRICIFSNAGRFVRSFGSCGNNEEQFDCPKGIAFSPNGNLYVSDYENKRVMIFSTQNRSNSY